MTQSKKEPEQLPDIPPRAGETCCLSGPSSVKRAALLFDRVAPWYPKGSERNATRIAIEVPEKIVFRISDCNRISVAEYDELLPEEQKTWQRKPESDDEVLAIVNRILYRGIIRNYFRRGIPVVSIYSSEVDFAKTFSVGDVKAEQAVLDSLPVPIEDKLMWEQVLECREDEELSLSSAVAARRIERG